MHSSFVLHSFDGFCPSLASYFLWRGWGRRRSRSPSYTGPFIKLFLFSTPGLRMTFPSLTKWDAEEVNNQCYIIHAGHHMAHHKHARKQRLHTNGFSSWIAGMRELGGQLWCLAPKCQLLLYRNVLVPNYWRRQKERIYLWKKLF